LAGLGVPAGVIVPGDNEYGVVCLHAHS
jgi:hypothetical protein